jgi:hypothetical protein
VKLSPLSFLNSDISQKSLECYNDDYLKLVLKRLGLMPLTVKISECEPDKLSSMLQVLSTVSSRIHQLDIRIEPLLPLLPHLELTNLRSISIHESITMSQLFQLLDMASLSEQDDIRFRMDSEIIGGLDEMVVNREGHPFFHKVKNFDLNWSDGMH